MAYQSVFELLVDIKADGARQLLALDKAIGNIGSTGAATAKRIDGIINAVKGLGAVYGVVKLAEAFDRAYDAGDRFASLLASMDKLTGNAEGALVKLRAASMGGLSDEQLALTANKMAGLGLTTAQTAKVIADGMRIAEATGKDFQESLGGVSRAIATGNSRALTGLGVVVDLKAATEAYAASLGKTVSQLTASERISARFAATGDAVQKSFGAVDMSRAIGEWEKLRTEVKNGFSEMTVQAASFGDALALAIRGMRVDYKDAEASQFGDIMAARADKLVAAAGASSEEVSKALAVTLNEFSQRVSMYSDYSEKQLRARLKSMGTFSEQTIQQVMDFAKVAGAEANATTADPALQKAMFKDMEQSILQTTAARKADTAQVERTNKLAEESNRLAAEAELHAKNKAYFTEADKNYEIRRKAAATANLADQKAIAATVMEMKRTGVDLLEKSGDITKEEAKRRRIALDIEAALAGQSGFMARMAQVAGVIAKAQASKVTEAADAKLKADEKADAAKKEAQARAAAAATQRREDEKARQERIKALTEQMKDSTIDLAESRGVYSEKEAEFARHQAAMAKIAASGVSRQEMEIQQRIEDARFEVEQTKRNNAIDENEAKRKETANDQRMRKEKELRQQAAREREDELRRQIELERTIEGIRRENALSAAAAMQQAADMSGGAAGRIAAAFAQASVASESYTEAQKQGAEATRAATPGLISASGAVAAALMKNDRAVAWVRAAFEAAAAIGSLAAGDGKGAALHAMAAAMYGVAATRRPPTASAGSGTGASAQVAASTQENRSSVTNIYYQPKGITVQDEAEAGQAIVKMVNLAGQRGSRLAPKIIATNGGLGI